MRDFPGGLGCPDVESLTNARERRLAVDGLEGAFPDEDHIPAQFLPSGLVLSVTSDVVRPLRRPEFDVGLRHGTGGAAVTMPEAAANFDERVGTGHDDVRMAGEAFVAGAETPSGGEDAFSYQQLRFRVARPDA